jgi:metal-sulfur cluster biosynthetic enzyme
MTDMILSDASLALESLLPDNAQIELNLVWEPPWTPAMMTKCARHHFGWDEPPDHLA